MRAFVKVAYYIFLFFEILNDTQTHTNRERATMNVLEPDADPWLEVHGTPRCKERPTNANYFGQKKKLLRQKGARELSRHGRWRATVRLVLDAETLSCAASAMSPSVSAWRCPRRPRAARARAAIAACSRRRCRGATSRRSTARRRSEPASTCRGHEGALAATAAAGVAEEEAGGGQRTAG